MVVRSQPGYTVLVFLPYWMDATAAPALATIARMMSHRRPLNVVKLSDQGGQCVLTIECGHRGHGRDARPETFARIAG